MLREVLYTTDDCSRWRTVLPARDSVFGSVEFASVVREYMGYQPVLYVLEDGKSRIAYPFFSRPISSLPLDSWTADGLSDTVSPEFTGPLAPAGKAESLALEFPRKFSQFAVNQGLVAEFIHLHPWKALTSTLVANCLQLNREIVYVDLTCSLEQLWRTSFTHACRKNINRSRRENVRIFEAQSVSDIREFYRIYIQTMKGRNALPQYYFSLDYFSAIFEQLRDNARFVLAEYRDHVVAGTLYLYDRDDIYSYLGGADVTFQHVRPSNAVIYDTILWGQQKGKKRVVLGAGYLPDDGIFRFKSSFSPKRVPFFVYKRVHLPAEYESLCRSWSNIYGQDSQSIDYFPSYRFLPSSHIAQDSQAVSTAADTNLVSS